MYVPLELCNELLFESKEDVELYLWITTSVPIYKTLLLKSRELRKWIFVLKLFVITIVFTILSLRERVSLCFPYVIYCWLKKNMYNK